MAQSASEYCRMVAAAGCDENGCSGLSLFDWEGEEFVLSDSIEPTDGYLFESYRVSHNGSVLAVSERSTAPLVSNDVVAQIHIFDISNEFIEKGTLPNVLFPRGSVWSHDSARLLLTDAEGQYFLYLYDLRNNTLTQIIPAPTSYSLRAFEVAWSPNDQMIAVVGDEHPFPQTENGINDVIALYIIRLRGGNVEYAPISSPQFDVGWYFDKFVWLSNQEIAFISYTTTDSTDTIENMKIAIATINGEQEILDIGDYHLLWGLPERRLLLSGTNDEEDRASLLLLDLETNRLTPLTELAIDEFTPFPNFSLSPSGRYIAYPTTNGMVEIQNLHDFSKRMVEVGVENDAGWWSIDESTLFFYDYVEDTVHTYNLMTGVIESLPSTVLFPDLTELPRFPQWVCAEA